MNPGGESWYPKLAIAAAAVAMISLAYFALGHRHPRTSPRASLAANFQLAKQFDFAGKTLAQRRSEVASFAASETNLSADTLLENLRGVICLISPPADQRSAQDSSQPDDNPQGELSYELESASAPPIELFPMSGVNGDLLFLLLSYASADRLEAPKLVVKAGSTVVQQIALSAFQALPRTDLRPTSGSNLVSLTKWSLQPDDSIVQGFMRPHISPFLARRRVPEYLLRLAQPVPAGQEAFVRLIRTDRDTDPENGDWHPIHGGTTSLFSWTGPLATQAEIELAFCKPVDLRQEINVALGQVTVAFDQPTFTTERSMSIPLTPSLHLELPHQDALPKRATQHAKRAVLISGRVNPVANTDQVPDSLKRIEWLSPSPEDLGLEELWLPWGAVRAAKPSTAPLKSFFLTGKLRVSVTRWNPVRRMRLVVGIQNPAK